MKRNQPKGDKKNKKLYLLVISMVLLSLTLTACGSSTPSNFPTGTFMKQRNDSVGMHFNEDGTWYGIYFGMRYPEGTYSVKGDLYIEESNSDNCGESPISFRYTFDGTNLHFELTEESRNDICADRNRVYDGTTWVLTK